MAEVKGYYVEATDGNAGHVEDFIAEDDSWIIRYVVVDTKNWLPGRKVLIAPPWIETVEWNSRRVYLSLDRETIKGSPEYDALAPVNKEYEARLYDYYGRPVYW
jgi:hypothetical protein